MYLGWYVLFKEIKGTRFWWHNYIMRKVINLIKKNTIYELTVSCFSFKYQYYSAELHFYRKSILVLTYASETF